MFKTQRETNVWKVLAFVFWIPIWKLFVHLAEDFLRNLGYSAFVDWLSSFGIPEERLIKIFDQIFPYLILVAGFWIINVCIKKAAHRNTKIIDEKKAELKPWEIKEWALKVILLCQKLTFRILRIISNANLTGLKN